MVQYSEALVDFSGGCAEHYDLKEEDSKEIYDLMMKAYEKSSMMACSMEPDPRRTEVRLFLKIRWNHTNSWICVFSRNFFNQY